MTDGMTLLGAVLDHVEKHGSITNRECRELLDISYDHAIKLLGGLSSVGVLERTGTASGTKYIRGSKRPPPHKVETVMGDVERLLKRGKRL